MHGNARLTPLGRLTLVMRIEAGSPAAHVAEEMGISRSTAYKWWNRWTSEGVEGLVDRPSTARSHPRRTPPSLEAAIVELRRTLKLGPLRISARLGVPASTVHRVLVRLGMNRLAWMDRPTGEVIRRITTTRPGELVHVDVKKLGRIPAGGGWRVRGVGYPGHFDRKAKVGYSYVHSAVDGHTRLAYSEVLNDEKGVTAGAFWQRARAFYAGYGITVEAVLTDNGACYKRAFDDALDAVEHRRTRPRRPQTNGKVERFNRTLLDEWAYVRPYTSDAERIAALDEWLHLYNHHRHHTALGGPPVSAVNNPAGEHSGEVSAVDALAEAVEAAQHGLWIACQVIVATVLDAQVAGELRLKYKELEALAESHKPDDITLHDLRLGLIFRSLPEAFRSFQVTKGDPIPKGFSRHATAHTVSYEQLSQRNAPFGLLLTTSLLRELHWHGDDQIVLGHQVVRNRRSPT